MRKKEDIEIDKLNKSKSENIKDYTATENKNLNKNKSDKIKDDKIESNNIENDETASEKIDYDKIENDKTASEKTDYDKTENDKTEKNKIKKPNLKNEPTKNEEPKKVNINFFKKLKISIFDFDKYYEIAGESFNRSFLYLAEIFIIFSLVISFIFMFKINEVFNDFNNYKFTNSDISEYTYKIADGYELTGEQLEILSKAGLTNIFVYVWIFTFLIYFITGLINVLAISVLGIITEKAIRLPLKYSAIFSITISATTLPTILYLIYIVVNFYTKFTMPYFQVMYLLISYIYLIAAMLMLKSNLIKRKLKIITTIEKNGNEKTETNE